MKEEKYHNFDIETYHAMKYAGIDNLVELIEISKKRMVELSDPCNTDPIEEELDNRILLA
jgi:hypothetical protein